MMMTLNSYLPLGLDPNEIALRSAEAAEKTALYTLWLAIGTFGLLAGAVIAAIYAGLSWKSAEGQLTAVQGQLDLASESKRREEADKVSVWLTQSGSVIKFFVRNENSGPIYDVNCTALCKPTSKSDIPTVEAHLLTFMAVAPAESGTDKDLRFELGSDGYVYAATRPDGVRLNKQRGTTVLMDHVDDWIPWDGKPGTKGLAVTLTFRDSSGIYWRRGWDGILSEIKKES